MDDSCCTPAGPAMTARFWPGSTVQTMSRRHRSPVVFAATGDVHGNFGALADALAGACEVAGVLPGELAVILSVGDLEASYNQAHVDMVHGPAKYRTLGDFPAVLSGEIVLPAPLAFIGGNHEPWEALDADGGLPHGGRWAPGVTFLGRAGLTTIAGLSVAYLSGIRSAKVSPRPANSRTSARTRTYYVDSELERVRAAGRKTHPDLLLTHDWPAGVGTTADGRSCGDEGIAGLITDIRPTLSLHGHMHHRASARIGTTAVECLGHIDSGANAVALFVSDGDTITALTP